MTRPNEPARPDIHARITNQIIVQLEAGVRPWTQPWAASTTVSRPLRHDGTPYSGVNILLLWSEAAMRGFAASTWMTFRQALALGGHVRKGERGATVVYANRIIREEADEAGKAVEESIPFLKAYTVFNLDQIDGLPERYALQPQTPINPEIRISEAEAFFEACGADIRHGGGSAFYAASSQHCFGPPARPARLRQRRLRRRSCPIAWGTGRSSSASWPTCLGW